MAPRKSVGRPKKIRIDDVVNEEEKDKGASKLVILGDSDNGRKPITRKTRANPMQDVEKADKYYDDDWTTVSDDETYGLLSYQPSKKKLSESAKSGNF
jgi:hypothetical protein